MTDEKKVIYTHFEGMCWPVPGERMNEIERTMRHSTPSRTDCLVAASIISAYRQMVGDSEKQRRFNLRHIRSALKKEIQRIGRNNEREVWKEMGMPGDPFQPPSQLQNEPKP